MSENRIRLYIDAMKTRYSHVNDAEINDNEEDIEDDFFEFQ